MALHRSFDNPEPDPVGRPSTHHEEHRVARTSVMASGTMACPACDVPVSPAGRPLRVRDEIACPFCGHVAAVRDFVALDGPARPALVDLRVVRRHR